MRKTADQTAVDILMAGGPRMDARLAALAAAVGKALGGGDCPACCAVGPHETNGTARAADLTFCCSCGEQWDAESV